MNQVRPGKILEKNDTIGVVALSAPGEASRLTRGIEQITLRGYKVRVAGDPTSAYGKATHLFASDSIEGRIAALRSLLHDKEVKAILAVRGAYGTMELLPHIPFDEIAQAGKILCGFSDTTALLIPWVEKAGVVALHGASLEGAFAKEGSDSPEKGAYVTSAEACLSMLAGHKDALLESITLSHLAGNGIAEGQLIGGNLSIVTALLGSPWAPSFARKILFLEEIGEKPYRVHRMLLQLKLAGVFSMVTGILLGSFTQCTHPKGARPSLEEVFADIFKESPVPVVRGYPGGHEPLNLPLPLGVRARLTPNHLELLGDAVL